MFVGAHSGMDLGGGGSEGGEGVFGWDPPSPYCKRKSSWHRRHRSKILAPSLKHWKRRGGGGSKGQVWTRH